MESFMRKFRKTTLYFWLVLVFPRVIIQIPSITFVRDKIMDAAWNISVWLIISSIIGVGLVQTNLFISLGMPTNIGPYIFVVIVILAGRILQNLFVVPAKLYFDARRVQDRHVWELVYVEKKGIPNKKASLGYGVYLRNDTPFEMPRVIFQLPYFDIDDVRHEQTEWFGFSQRPDSHIRRLTWQSNDNSIQATEKQIEPDGGSALAYLFDVLQKSDGSKEFYIRYNEVSEKSGKFEEKSKQVKSRASGLLILHGGGINNRFYFEIFIDEDQEVMMKFSNQPISTYKPPKTEVL
jgi:hypothetical protein